MLTTILAPTRRLGPGGRLRRVEEPRRGARARRAWLCRRSGLDPLMTAREMLVLQAGSSRPTATQARATAERLLTTVGLDDVDPKKRVGQFSGGMKRRLDLALALVNDPLRALPRRADHRPRPGQPPRIWDEVRRLNSEQGMTIFLTTQYLEEADKLADEVAIIDRGKIVAQGAPRALKKEIGNEVVTLYLRFRRRRRERAASVLERLAAQTGSLAGGDLLCYFAAAAGQAARAGPGAGRSRQWLSRGSR